MEESDYEVICGAPSTSIRAMTGEMNLDELRKQEPERQSSRL